ncbi:hypothetical protein SUGI_0453670 [Cryptomeria japonica]|nr:hypothetical protein SUGI_0453670 [Cryptomeria japonica]
MSASCTVRFEIYPFVESGNLSSSPSPSPEASSPPSTTSHTSSPPVALGPSEPTSQGKSSVVLVLLICLIAMRKRVKSGIFGRPITTATHNEDRHAFSPQSELRQQEQCFIFILEELAGSTKNFHDNNKLGEGGFGSVYVNRNNILSSAWKNLQKPPKIFMIIINLERGVSVWYTREQPRTVSK